MSLPSFNSEILDLEMLMNGLPSMESPFTLKFLALIYKNLLNRDDINRLQICIFNANPPEFWFQDNDKYSDDCLLFQKLLRALVENFTFEIQSRRWSSFLNKAIHIQTPKVKWWIIRFLQILVGISEKRVVQVLSDNIEFEQNLRIRLASPQTSMKKLLKLSRCISKSKGTIAVNVSGSIFIIPSISQDVSSIKQVCAPCPSAETAFDTLCSASSAGLPVLVQGPVGCGKSTLLRYMAQSVQRHSPPSLVTIQLGEQMDSKALFGSYCCTQVPGEFVWKPGPVTLAAEHGNWIILEDIESATEDIIASLLLLIENKNIRVPGLKSFRVHSQFRLFATSRNDGRHSIDLKSTYILERFPVKITLTSFSKQELIRMICSGSRLSEISRPLVDAFMLAGHSLTQANVLRQIGPRDLLKWHRRLHTCAIDDHISIYREATDCLLRYVRNTEKRNEALAALGNKLNVTQQQVEYYETVHKPTVKITSSEVEIGRAKIKRIETENLASRSQSFALTLNACQLLERLALCISHNEPVLLVGETGCGKTATVQFLADYTGHQLHVVNLSPQSESTDLLGGYKPVTFKTIASPLKEDYVTLFEQSFDMKKNKKFLKHIQSCYLHEQWTELIEIMMHTAKKAISKSKSIDKWTPLLAEIEKFRRVVKSEVESLPFGLIEGVLVSAIRKGDWVLLDEINLAPPETLDCLYSFLDAIERDDPVLLPFSDFPIKVHHDFRLISCMNPATDVGKKDLVSGIRNRLTEFFVEEVNSVQDLKQLSETYLRGLSVPAKTLDAVVQLYLDLKLRALSLASDSWGHHPQYSLRTFCRALSYASSNPFGNVKRSLYEAFCVSFMTELDLNSQNRVRLMVQKSLLSLNLETAEALIATIPKQRNPKSMLVEGFWIETGTEDAVETPTYIITPSVKTNLHNLARAISAKRFPILLQGETCVGKTSLIKYVASLTRNKVVRINNHEHTDLQEYLGSYSSDSDGKLNFVEGPLVEAMRDGYWVILDELNLAPIDVLEALNRVLDDNREIFIPETQTVVKAHPSFQLLATQNPPGLYGGRKELSRAFRNRFIQLNFSEFPEKELENILQNRCGLPSSYTTKMVATMHELQVYRNSSGVFAGKESYMTLRDLFRWGERYSKAQERGSYHDWDQYLADQGFLLLGGRCRRSDDSKVVTDVLTKLFKRAINPDHIYSLNSPYLILNTTCLPPGFQHIVWTRNTLRVAVLLGQAIKFDEPCLLIGDTGCGKTSLCQMLSHQLGTPDLLCISCHLMSEAGDFLGRLRPAPIQDAEKGVLFKWCDGPLVTAMKEGAPILVDEISLADDSVLERLNSVLETERTLLLPELPDSSEQTRSIVAKAGFKIMATMNPGGDFGKKELSRALRNRFTEIWCDSDFDREDLVSIAHHNLHKSIKHLVIPNAMLNFVSWLMHKTDGRSKLTFTVRNLLAWIHFMNEGVTFLDHAHSFIHGSFLVLLDSLGCASSLDASTLRQYLHDSLEWLCQYCNTNLGSNICPKDISLPTSAQVLVGDKFGLHPFFIDTGELVPDLPRTYSFDAPTCRHNVLAVLRGLAIAKPLLLEGPPGVGKSSLIVAIASAAGHKLTRLNLSEQTELSDLLGTDVPVSLANGQQAFTWSDGPLLTAMKEGHWVLLDEMNLASQAVLEGLNACLDHRGQIFIPELGKSFKVSSNGTRFFACQNPYSQGGDRRGLPKSFINRFCPVYVQELTAEDELMILQKSPHALPLECLQTMIKFNTSMKQELCVNRSFGSSGAPWEFNLRDLMRWAEVMNKMKTQDCSTCIDLVYFNRLRNVEDRNQALKLAEEVTQSKLRIPELTLSITPEIVHCGRAVLKRFDHCPPVDSVTNTLLLKSQLPSLEQLLHSLSIGWVTLIVGSCGIGKSTIVKTAAGLCGRTLHTVYLSAETDAAELLGCFEQVSLEHRLGLIKQSILDVCDEKCGQVLDLINPNDMIKCIELRDECSSSKTPQQLLNVSERLSHFMSLPENIKLQAHELEQSLEKVGTSFEWTESDIVHAYRNGSWLLVENVNMCSASVLDRLNSALEPQGQITLAECGTDKYGNIPVYSAHPQFRIIFTMDARFGPISRAMRNRANEMCMIDEEAWYKNGQDAVNVIKQVAELDVQHANQVFQQFQLARENDGKLNGHNLTSTALQVGWALRKKGEALTISQYARLALNLAPEYEEDMDCEAGAEAFVLEPRCAVRDVCYDSVGAVSYIQSQAWAYSHNEGHSRDSCQLWTVLSACPATLPFRLQIMKQIWQSEIESQSSLISCWNNLSGELCSTEYELWDPRIYPMLALWQVPNQSQTQQINGVLCSLIYTIKFQEAHTKIESESALDYARKVNSGELNVDDLISPALALMIKINNRLKKLLKANRIMTDEQANGLLSELWTCLLFMKSCRQKLNSLHGQLVTLRTLWTWIKQRLIPLLIDHDKLSVLCKEIDDDWNVEVECELMYLQDWTVCSLCDPFPSKKVLNNYSTALELVQRMRTARNQMADLTLPKMELLDLLVPEVNKMEHTTVMPESTDLAKEWLIDYACMLSLLISRNISDEEMESIVSYSQTIPQAIAFNKFITWHSKFNFLFSTLQWLNAPDLNSNMPKISWMNIRNVHCVLMPSVTFNLCELLEKCNFGNMETIPMKDVSTMKESLKNTSALMWKYAQSLMHSKQILSQQIWASGLMELTRELTGIDLGSDIDGLLSGQYSSEWMSIGISCMQKLTPPLKMMDPVLKAEVQISLMKQQLEFVSNELNLLNDYNTNLTGRPMVSDWRTCHPHPFINSLITKKSNLEAEILSTESLGRTGYRPHTSQFEQICVDMASFLSLTQTSIMKCEKLSGKLYQARLIAWLQSAEHLMNRLVSSYPAYVDVTFPFLLGLSMTMLGANQHLFNLISHENLPNLSVSVENLLNLVETKWMKREGDFGDNGWTLAEGTVLSHQSQIHLIKSTLEHVSDEETSTNCLKFIVSNAHEIDEMKEKEQPLSYKYHKKKAELEGEDEDTVDADLIARRLLFPGVDFEENEEEEGKELKKMVKKRTTVEKETIELLRMLMRNVASKHNSASMTGVSSNAYSCAMQIIHEQRQAFMLLDERTLLEEHIVQLKGMEKGLNACDVPVTLDVYRDTCSAVAVPLIQKILNLKDAVQRLHTEWPEISALPEICESADLVLNYPIGTPVVQLSLAVEDLLRVTEEWEKVASRAVSLESYLSPLRVTLLQWRKQEVRSWEQLLQRTETDFDDKLLLEAMPFIEAAITDQAMDDSKVEEICSTAMQWMQDALLIDFSTRLRVLEFVIRWMDKFREDSLSKTLASRLMSMKLYWSEYSARIGKHLSDVKIGIEKELKDVVKVIKFQDLSLWSVKLMSQKAHSQLFRIVKKYKESITLPVTSNISQLFSVDSEKVVKLSQFQPSTGPSLKICSRTSILWKDARCHSINMISRLDTDSCLQSLFDLTDSAAETCDALNQDINYDAAADKETKEKLYRRNMSRRQILVSSLLKSLKESGFMYRKGSLLSAESLGASLVLKLPQTKDHTGLQLLQILRKCAANRCVLTAATSKPNKQVTSQTAKSINGLAQLFPSLLLGWVNALTKSTEEYATLSSECKAMGDVIEELNAIGSVVSKQDAADNCLKEIRSIDAERLSFVAQARSVLQCTPQDQSSCPIALQVFQNFNAPISYMTTKSEQMECMKTELDSANRQWYPGFHSQENLHITRHVIEKTLCPDGISTLENLSKDFVSTLNPMIQISCLKLDAGKSKIMIPSLLMARNCAQSLNTNVLELRSIIDECEGGSEDGFGNILEDALRQLLLILQRMIHKFDVIVNATDSVPAGLDSIVSLLQIASSKQLLSRLNELRKGVVAHSTIQPDILQTLCGVQCLTTLLIELMQYLQSTCVQYLTQTSNLYLTLTNAFHKLLSDGFMPPIPDIEQGEGKGGVGELKDIEGGGIGEGEGNKDVSDQIEETGQVEGTKDEDKSDEAPPPNKDEDNPLEMEDDLDAALEDVKLDEGEESSEEDGTEDQTPEPDVQMGENDEPQEEQLDPKLWEQPEVNELGQDQTGVQEESDNVVAKDEQDTKEELNDNKEGQDFKENEEGGEEEKEENVDEDKVEMENVDMRDVDSVDASDEDGNKEENKVEDDAVEQEADEDNKLEPEQVNEETAEEETELKVDDKSTAQMTSASNTGRGQNEEEEVDVDKSENLKEENEVEEKDENMEEPEETGDPSKEKGVKRSHEGEVGDAAPKQMSNPPLNKRKKLSNDEKTLGDASKSFKTEADIDKGESGGDKGSDNSNVWSHDPSLGDNNVDQVMDAATLEQVQSQVHKIEDESAMDVNEQMDEVGENVDKAGLKVGQFDEGTIEHGGKQEDTKDIEELMNEQEPRSLSTTIHTVPDFYQHALQLHSREESFVQPTVSPGGSDGQSLWSHYRSRTDQLAAELSENLRLILEPSKASKLQGDYRTGKRLNIRKLIPYIASHFRKDKIWLRRTKKNKRDYRILVAVDDSASMGDNKTKEMALESVALLCNALKYMDAGQVAVCKFGIESQLLHAFGDTLSDQAGATLLSNITFEQKATDIIKLMELASTYLGSSTSSESGCIPSHLLLIVSDGRGLFSQGIDKARRAVQAAMQNNIFIFFIVLDNPEHKDSILDIQVPIFKGPNSMPQIKSYLDFFPFPFYVILRKMEALPATAGDALRQWFELVASDNH